MYVNTYICIWGHRECIRTYNMRFSFDNDGETSERVANTLVMHLRTDNPAALGQCLFSRMYVFAYVPSCFVYVEVITLVRENCRALQLTSI